MRNSLFFLLLASAAMPAMADDQDAKNDSKRAARIEAVAEAPSERQAERAQPAERVQQPERVEPPAQGRTFEPRQQDRPQMVQQPAEVSRERVMEHRSNGGFGGAPASPAMEQRRESVDSVRDWRSRERRVDNPAAAVEQPGDTTDSVREWRGRERRVDNNPAQIGQHNGSLGNGSFRELRREPNGRDGIGNRRGPLFGSIPQPGTQPPLPNSNNQWRNNRLSSLTAQHWRNDWRSDNHYDWRNHRQRHGSLFHLGFYFDPFGWNYRHYSIGSRLWSNYYQSNYWLNDPWQYRLPYAPPGYRWIRYYDDAILIDTWDGQVADVIYNFFW
ncbi:RcnB family protein [Sphingomonas sp.]|uniref:RcnB family protein n=1 Tax=Sphingomonas sp. TaxID=28214 RepID=UPI00286A0E90|nr:RcnB family protein [Sphingomonas sp.]